MSGWGPGTVVMWRGPGIAGGAYQFAGSSDGSHATNRTKNMWSMLFRSWFVLLGPAEILRDHARRHLLHGRVHEAQLLLTSLEDAPRLGGRLGPGDGVLALRTVRRQ